MAWTKLIAVNRVLRAGGEQPVTDLTSNSPDSLMAEAILDEVNYEQQLVGLACNTEELDFVPDSEGKIAVDETVLHIESIAPHGLGSTTSDAVPTEDFIVQRGGFLYNVTQNTNVFEDTIRCRVVYGLPFADLPFAQQVSIADEAARRYQLVNVGDAGADAVLRELFAQSRAMARAQDMRSRNAGIFGRWGNRRAWFAAKRTNRGYR